MDSTMTREEELKEDERQFDKLWNNRYKRGILNLKIGDKLKVSDTRLVVIKITDYEIYFHNHKKDTFAFTKLSVYYKIKSRIFSIEKQ